MQTDDGTRHRDRQGRERCIRKEWECQDIVGGCGCVHGEEMLLRSMPNPLYVSLSHAPCFNCATLLLRAGVKQVSYLKPYRLIHGVYHLEINGVQVIDLSGVK